MPPKGAKATRGAIVYVPAAKLVKAQPQLGDAVRHCLPQTLVGKYLTGKLGDPDGIKQGEAQWRVQFTGIAAGQVIGRRLFSLVPPAITAAMYTGHCESAKQTSASEIETEAVEDVVVAGDVTWAF